MKSQTVHPFWRQGDIYFVKLDNEPNLEDANPVKTGVIARGEETGHMHRLSPSSLESGAELTVLAERMYLRAPKTGATIIHDEHGPIQLPVGLYAVINQQEFDGLRWRTVID
jgi:hypothetical protein